MARIPTVTGPQVADRPTAPGFTNTNFDTGGAAVQQGLAQLGAGARAVDDAIQKAKQQADAIAIADTETELQKRWTARMVGDSSDPNNPKPGFLSSKGKYAAEESAATLEEMDKDRRELADKLNDRQKALYLRRTGGLFEDQRRRVEGHVAQQIQVAAEDAVKGRAAVALTAIANAYADPAEVARQEASVEGPIRALQTSKEDGDARIAAWRAEVSKTRLNQFLATRDWQGAQALYAQVKEQLGPQSVQFEKQISVMKQDQEAEGKAADFIAMSRDPKNGRVDSAKAIAELEKVPAGPERDEVRQRLEHRVALESAAWKQRVDATASSAFTAYLKTGSLSGVDSRDKAWLIENAPEEWARLQDRARAARERNRNEETDAQREALLRVRVDMEENPDKYREMTPDAFISEWGPELSDSGFRTAGAHLASLKKEPKGTGTEFVRQVNDYVQGDTLLQGNRREQGFFRTYMGDRRRAFIQEKKREPNAEEIDGFQQDAWKKLVDKTWLSERLGITVFDKEKPAYKAAAEDRASAKKAAPATPRTAVPPGMDLEDEVVPLVRPSRAERISQLKASKVSRAEAERILTSEGY